MLQRLATLLALVMTATVSPATDLPDPRPNFVIMLADDLGYGDLGSYGHATVRTPNLDRLAEQGMRFTDFYSAAPVCSPARAGLLTGRIPGRTGIWDWIPPGSDVHLSGDETTIATLLRDAGYATAMAGKWHLNGGLNTDQPQPDDHGFEHWFATASHCLPSHRNPFDFARNGEELGPLEGWACQLVSDEAIEWLGRTAADGRPFFLLLSYHEPHERLASPPEIIDSYPATQNRYEAEYFANVTNLDNAVGRVLAALETNDLDHNTVVLFTSDNGPEMHGRHPEAQRSYGSAGILRGKKLQLWEGGIRVPAILRWPVRAPAGVTSSQPASFVDLLPTVCELAGVALPEEVALDGVSLAPVLDGHEVARTSPLFWYHYRAWGGPRAAMRDGRWKIVGFWDGPEIIRASSGTMRPGDQESIRSTPLVRFELFDLETDPGEHQDVFSDHPERAQAMQERLVAMHRDVITSGRMGWSESWLRMW